MRNRYNEQREDAQFRLMLLLQESPDLTQREIAQRLGISSGSLNYCLRALIDKGYVKVQSFANSKNKLGYAYIMTPAGLAHRLSLTGQFLARKMSEYQALKIELEKLQGLSAGAVGSDISIK